mgnify:CR=1 FL=1|jgi:CDP-diacylglycerol--glycerol-3-phosphate 3-phosphatidyltransferase
MTESQNLDRVWTVPNVLSALRFLLSIVFFVAVGQGWNSTAVLIFVIAVSTDWIDGWWARRFNQMSRLGRMFDPLVDKVIICGAYVLLSAAPESVIPPWMAVVVVVRELVVTAIRSEMERTGHDFSAGQSGKFKMVLQCLAVTLELSSRAWVFPEGGVVDIRSIATVVAWAAVIATVWSGLEYVFAARKLIVGDDSDA